MIRQLPLQLSVHLLTLLLGFMIVHATSVRAELTPHPSGQDLRIQKVEYNPDEVVGLTARLGYALTVELSRDERVENVAIGDNDAWQVQVNQRGDRLFIRPTSGTETNLTVLTDARRYSFVLRTGASSAVAVPFVVRFTYRPPETEPATPQVTPLAQYRLRGDKSLWPSSISDDGQFTSIVWPAGMDMPAVYLLDHDGKTRLVNGLVQNGAYVIEGISPKLRFTRGKKSATASRRVPSVARP